MSIRRLLPSVPRLALTLMIALTLAVPASYVLSPHIYRWRMLAQLDADDAAAREHAMNFVIHRAAEDPRVLRGALEALKTANDGRFTELVAALQNAGVWSRRDVPDRAWLRWLTRLAASSSAEGQAFAAHRLAEMTSFADDARLIGTLGRLLESEHADVRYNALATAATLLGGGGDAATYERLIGSRTDDPEPKIARHAWILLGLIDPASGYVANWRSAPPQTAEAILWATMKTNPGALAPAIAALRSAAAAPAVRAAAAYALHLSDDPRATQALLDAADVPPSRLAADNQWVVWRAILALPRPNLRREPYSRLERVVVGWAMDDGSDPLAEPLALAAVYQMGIAGARRQTDDPAGYDALLKLATVEGQRPPYMRWPLTGDKPPLLRVMTVAVDAQPQIGDLRPAFESSLAAIRDLAVVIAAEKFDDETLGGMVESLLLDYNDDAKMSGAMLAGLSGAGADLLRKRAEAEDVWAVQQVMRLGLWMQDAGEATAGGEATAEGSHHAAALPSWPASLLIRDEVPHTTILLAMMQHGRRSEALDYLLAPRGEPPLDLVELLAQKRWWHVLARYLPPDSPPFWIWADPGLERFQIDVLRDWWLLRRATVDEATDAASDHR